MQAMQAWHEGIKTCQVVCNVLEHRPEETAVKLAERAHLPTELRFTISVPDFSKNDANGLLMT